eukprot:gene38801-47189_t
MLQEACRSVVQLTLSIPDDVIAGAFAGVVARMLTAPFDVLKIRYQLGSLGFAQSSSLITATKSIVKEEGITALWKGNVPALFLWVSYSIVQFASYGWLKSSLVSKNNSKNVLLDKLASSFMAGSIASTLATVITYPFDIMRTQFAIQGKVKTFHTMLSFVSHTISAKGPTGLFAGLGPAVISITPYIGLNFALYESLRSLIPKDASWPLFKTGLAGGIAGGLSKLCVYPLDTVKKRMQAASSVLSYKSSSSVPSLSLKSCVKEIYHMEGVRGFYRGLLPTMLKSVAATAITFASFESAKSFLEASRKPQKES